MQTPTIAAVILAAGESSRFGQPKQLLDWQGRPLIAHIADTAWAAGFTPVIVVLGAGADEIALALAGRPVQVLTNYRWAAGVSTSLAVGVAALPAHVEAALFLQADQPGITPRFLQTLATRWRETGAGIVVPTWEGQYGSPVLFARELFPALAQLSGDVGGRALFTAHADRLVTLPVAEPLLLHDLDTPEAYAQLRAQVQGAEPDILLRPIRAVIADMDGVLWRGDAALPGLANFFTFLSARHIPFQLVTNNASRTPAQYVEKLAGFGIAVNETQVLNSAMAAAHYVREHAPPGAKIYAIGGPGVPHALLAAGLQVTQDHDAEYVVVGWDRQMTWERLAMAAQLIRRGCPFIGTNPDRTFPTENGLVPGNGAQLAFLETGSDRPPLVMGKPAPHLYQQALARMEADPETTLVIGDRLDTDILGGLRLGMPTALLLSGITTRELLAQSPIHPAMIFADLADLITHWQKAHPELAEESAWPSASSGSVG